MSKFKGSITQDSVKRLFQYRKGLLFWKEPRVNGKVKRGDQAGGVDGRYHRVMVNYKRYQLHSLVFLYHHGFLPKQIDHINGDKLDNRVENLRECNTSQNAMNKGMTASNTSGVKGVHWNTKQQKWKAGMRVLGKYKHFGCFDTIFDAACVAIPARDLHHKEFANHG